MISIPFNEISSFPPLVTKSINGTAKLDFGFSTSVDQEFLFNSQEFESKVNRPREILRKILHQQLDKFNPPDIINKNINALGDPNTLAIVTGQQVGLGGGPLLTLLKAMTAVAIARKAENETGIRTVPVFWMAASDHNYNETAQLRWLNLNNDVEKLIFTDDDNRVPVGQLKLGQVAEQLVERLGKDLPDNEFKTSLLEKMTKAYHPENTFANAFQQLGTDLLGNTGLLLINPEDPELKQHTAPFWVNLMNNLEENGRRILGKSEEIEKSGYKVQVPVFEGRPSMFIIENQMRRKIVLEGRNKRGQSEKIFSVKQLQELAANTPEKLSAGVTMRPLLQGYLLPTAAYIAGPHEMAYWAQLSGSFELMKINKPAVLHRTTLTLIENKVQKKLDNLGLAPETFLGNTQEITNSFINRESEYSIDTEFEQMHSELKKMLGQLRKKLSLKPYSGLDSAVENTTNKIEHQLNVLQDKFNTRLLNHDKNKRNMFNTVSTHLKPAGNLQERVISPLYFFARYGEDLLEGLINISANEHGYHHFVNIEELLR